MASRTAKTMNEPDEAITRGKGNVFVDLGYPMPRSARRSCRWRTRLMRSLPGGT